MNGCHGDKDDGHVVGECCNAQIETVPSRYSVNH